MAALAVLCIYISHLLDSIHGNFFGLALIGVAFLLSSTLAGKMIGIGLARLRLVLLYRAFARDLVLLQMPDFDAREESQYYFEMERTNATSNAG